MFPPYSEPSTQHFSAVILDPRWTGSADHDLLIRAVPLDRVREMLRHRELRGEHDSLAESEAFNRLRTLLLLWVHKTSPGAASSTRVPDDGTRPSITKAERARERAKSR